MLGHGVNRQLPLFASVVVGDIHINVKEGNFEFEQRRVVALTTALLKASSKEVLLVLAGDIFDKNRPSLEDIKLFYNLIDSLLGKFKDILVIAGNHDKETFEFIPEVGFTAIQTVKELYGILFVPWPQIHTFSASLQSNPPSNLPALLISHARCTLGDFIEEEVSMETLSKSFSTVILGDIHHFYSPYPNIFYTSSPSNNSFVQLKENTQGFVTVDTVLNVTEVTLSLPRRELIVINGVSKLQELKLLPVNLYKIRILDTLEALQKLDRQKYKGVRFELIPLVSESNTDYGYKEQLAASVYDQLAIHMEKFKFSKSTIAEAIELIQSK